MGLAFGLLRWRQFASYQSCKVIRLEVFYDEPFLLLQEVVEFSHFMQLSIASTGLQW